MKKRGLSGVIATMLIIVISLTAVVILWTVISNIINKGSSGVNLGGFTINMDIKKVISYSNSTDIFVKRNPGQGSLSGIRFVISDGTDTYLFDKKDTPLNELEEKAFNINYTGPIKKVSISPIIKLGSTDTPQNPADDLEYTNYNTVKNMAGLVSWWKFEGNANDEIGRNPGTGYDSQYNVAGKFNQGYNFPTSNQISFADNPSIQLANSNYTIISWINLGAYTGAKRGIFWKGTGAGNVLPAEEYGLMISKNGSTRNLYGGTNKSSVIGNVNLTTLLNIWIHVATSQAFNITSNTITKVYVNGDLDNQSTSTAILTNPQNYGAGLGTTQWGFMLYGIIDETMIFNRTLSDQEIKALYNLDLSP